MASYGTRALSFRLRRVGILNQRRNVFSTSPLLSNQMNENLTINKEAASVRHIENDASKTDLKFSSFANEYSWSRVSRNRAIGYLGRFDRNLSTSRYALIFDRFWEQKRAPALTNLTCTSAMHSFAFKEGYYFKWENDQKFLHQNTITRATAVHNNPLSSKFYQNQYLQTCRNTFIFQIPSRNYSHGTKSQEKEESTNASQDELKPHRTKSDENLHLLSNTQDRNRLQSFSTQIRSIPNMITLARIFSTPYLSFLIISNQYNYALAGCTIAAFSDYLDGYIAKQYNSTTVLGTYLDPFADKFIINTLAISLGYQSILPVWIVGLWLGRDVGLMATTYWWVRKHTDTSKGQAVIDPGRTPLQVHPTDISKMNTILQFFTLFGGMGVGMMDGAGSEYIMGLCYITAGTTVMSGLSYVGGASLKMSTNVKKDNETKDTDNHSNATTK